MTSPTINVQGVTHKYGAKVALNNISLTLETGHFCALLGPNGAGKTTLFSLLTRLLHPVSGTIELFGNDLTKNPGAGLAKTGVVFQQSTLDLDLTILQNLAYHGAIQGMSPKSVMARAQPELERFHLWERRNEKVRSLNGGHRRRVEIARALLHQPSLLLLDEASAGLDLETRTSLYNHVRALSSDKGLAVLWTTHLVEELSPTDDAILLSKGEIKDRGSLQTLTENRGVSTPAELVLTLGGARS